MPTSPTMPTTPTTADASTSKSVDAAADANANAANDTATRNAQATIDAAAEAAEMEAKQIAKTGKATKPKAADASDTVELRLSSDYVWRIPGGDGLPIRYPRGEKVAVHRSFAEHLTATQSADAPKG